MKCIICDKCKEIIEDPSQVRIVTCSRPMKRPAVPEDAKRNINHRTQDVIWDKELCMKCALELEQLVNGESAESTE